MRVKEIKKRMIDADVTASDLAQAMGITTSQTYRILKGQFEPDLEKAHAIQKVLNIPDEQFWEYFGADD